MAEIIKRFRATDPARQVAGVLTTSQTLDKGMLVAYDADGKMRELNDTANYVFAGIAIDDFGGTNEPSTPIVECEQGFFYPYDSAAQTDVGITVYASGLGTLASSSSNSVEVGRVIEAEVGVGWWILPIRGAFTVSSNVMKRDGTDVRPYNAGDAIQTDDPATAAAVLTLDDNGIAAAGTGTNIDIELTPKGTGVVTNGTDPLLPYKASGQATTGTGGTVGQVTATGVTSSAVIICTGAETGADVAYVVAGTDLFTVFDASDSEIDAKKVNYIILSY